MNGAFEAGARVRVRSSCRYLPGEAGTVRDLLRLAGGPGYGVVLDRNARLGWPEGATDYGERELEPDVDMDMKVHMRKHRRGLK